MQNHFPIFVNGFSRGGTTILTNLLSSHPDVCLVGETHHVFKGHSITDSRWRVIQKCLAYDAPVMLTQWENFFSPRLVKPRRQLTPWTQKLIDRILYHEKARSRHPLLNRFKSPGHEYSDAEVRQARLLCKNIDGMIYTCRQFARMYQDATFFGLVRHGLAVCEGHMRRGRSPREIGWRYRVLVDRMLEDRQQLARYQLVRFEDLVAAPLQTLRHLHGHAALPLEGVQEIRMQVRRVMDADGNHQLSGAAEWDVVWLKLEELNSYLRTDVDENQIKRLSRRDRSTFLRQAGDAMERLGYATDGRNILAPGIFRFGFGSGPASDSSGDMARAA